jgi:glutathione S-transferase
MSELVLYDNILSQPARSVKMFCKLSGINFTSRPVHLSTGDNLTEEYTKLNPFQTIPTIVHNSYSLWESAAIVPYLADAFDIDNQWYPKDIKIRGKINAYLHWHHTATREPLENFLLGKVLGPIRAGRPVLSEAEDAPYREKVNEWFETFKWQLAETHYAARTQGPTIADIFAFNELGSAAMFFDLSRHPEVQLWFEEIRGIPIVGEIYGEALELSLKILGR